MGVYMSPLLWDSAASAVTWGSVGGGSGGGGPGLQLCSLIMRCFSLPPEPSQSPRRLHQSIPRLELGQGSLLWEDSLGLTSWA